MGAPATGRTPNAKQLNFIAQGRAATLRSASAAERLGRPFSRGAWERAIMLHHHLRIADADDAAADAVAGVSGRLLRFEVVGLGVDDNRAADDRVRPLSEIIVSTSLVRSLPWPSALMLPRSPTWRLASSGPACWLPSG